MKDIMAAHLKGDYPQLLFSAHLICPDLLLNEIIHFAPSLACTYSKKGVVALVEISQAADSLCYAMLWLEPLHFLACSVWW